MGCGYVVRIRLGGGGLTYNSRRVNKSEAESRAAVIERELRVMAPEEFYHFDWEYDGVVRLRVERITAIEAACSYLPIHRPAAPTSGTETR